MPIEHGKGGTVITGDSIEYFALCSIRGALGLEIKGLKMSRGRSAYKTAKVKYGLKGTREEVHYKLSQMIDDLRSKQEHRTVVDGRVVREVEGKEVN